jgi:hypothetical protein
LAIKRNALVIKRSPVLKNMLKDMKFKSKLKIMLKNKDITKDCASKYGKILKYAPYEYLDDKEIVQSAVQNNGWVIY